MAICVRKSINSNHHKTTVPSTKNIYNTEREWRSSVYEAPALIRFGANLQLFCSLMISR